MARQKQTRKPDIRIEYPARGTTYCHDRYGVYEYGEHPSSSVLYGRERRLFLQSYDTLEEAQAAYPTADVTGSCFQPDSFQDLPGEDD